MSGTYARPPSGGAISASDGSTLTHREAADYIASMLERLHLVAKSAEMPFLAYLIDVALEEAKNQKGRSG